MNWMNILKSKKEENYGNFLSELKRLEKEKDRKVQELLAKVRRERPKNPVLNKEEVKELDRIVIPLAEYKKANEEFVERMKREERSARSIELSRKYYERLRNEQKSRMSGKNLKVQGKKGGRKKKKKRKGEFKVQRGSGQSKSQRRSGGRDDSRRFRKL